MTSGSDGLGPRGGRHRGRFTENAKPLAAVLTGIAALLLAIAGTVTLVCSHPDGDPASAVTTTAVGVLDGSSSTAGPTPGSTSAPTSTPTPTSSSPTSTAATPTSTPSTPTSGTSPSPTTPTSGPGSTPTATPPTTRPSAATPPPPQWEGDIQVDSAGYSLATVPPTPDQSGDPDISATFDGSFFASFGAAQWSDTAPPSPEACAALIQARGTAYVTGVPGDVYCVRVAHSATAPGSQYAMVRIVGQGRDAANLPFVLVHAVVWPGQ